MRAFLTSIFCIVLLFFTSAQKRYQLPAGISREQISDKWIIVKTKDETVSLTELRNEVVSLHKKQSAKPSILDGFCKVKVQEGEDPIELINLLLLHPDVVYAEPILDYKPLYIPSDPDNGTSQEYLSQISAYDAWELTRGDDDVTIAIIDTGLDLDHEDLSTSIWTNEGDPIDGIDNDGNGYVDDFYGYDFADEDSDPNADGSKHGARVGGLAGADTDNSIGISGVGFNSKIAALKGFKTIGTTSNNLFEAIIYAVDNGMQILNLSWGALGGGLQSEQEIIDYAVLEKNAVVIAAAGNTNVDGKFYPASYNNVISVGATDVNDNRWSSSTYNYSVDIMAPGVSIYSTESDDSYGTDSGTSYASPMVAGAAALVKAAFPNLIAQQIMERIRVSADDIYNVGSNALFEGKLGLGRLNVFNAVSQTNLKSLRVIDFNVQTSYSNSIFFGDTVTVTGNFTNYLSKLDAPQITISSPDNNFTIAENTFFPGSLNTLDESSISFEIILDENLPPETPVDIRLDYQDGTYSDFQFLETATSPDNFDFGSNLKMTVAGNGNLAFSDTTFQEGIGIEFNQSFILKHAGLIIADSETTVSDNIVSDYLSESRDQDFISFSNFKMSYHPGVNLFGYSEFEDSAKNLIIEQSSYSVTNEDFIILRYRIINNSANPINNLSIGFFSDFDLNNSLENRAEYDAAGSYLFTRDNGGTIFAGTKIIATGTIRYSALDVDNQNGNTSDIQDIFSDSIKYEYLINQQIGLAGSVGNGNDVAMINGISLAQINAFDKDFFTVIIAASTSQNGLENAFTDAENTLNETIQNPRILGSIFSCEGSQVTIDPENGDNFQFFQDANGSILLQSGTSFQTGAINKDTIFYIQNMDGAYPSDIFQYQVKLIADVADFTISPDTLYLDNGTNVVSFLDQSFQPTSWSWDFGEGTTSTIQSPLLSFASAGEYTISLSIVNATGCSDTQIKTLVVSDRPQTPSFQVFNICPGDSITISDSSADYLKVFESEEAVNYLYKGNNVIAGPFSTSTTLYASGTYNQFESLRTPISIVVDDFLLDITIEIDTLSTEHQIIARAQTDEVILDWLINDISQGNANEIVITSSEVSATINLTAEKAGGCRISKSENFTFSSSPIPSQQDINFCTNETPVIRPQNGEIFGFYDDNALTSLIKKGTELQLTGQTLIFVVGLDDGLPSLSVEVGVTYEKFDLEIVTMVENVSDKNKVTFSTNPAEGIVDYKWYVDGILSEVISNPTLFFGIDTYEIVLSAINGSGCTQNDTIQLDFIPPLGFNNSSEFSIYPNPSNGMISLTTQEELISLSLWDLAGKKQMARPEVDDVIDLTYLAPGIYILKGRTKNETFEKRLIIQPD